MDKQIVSVRIPKELLEKIDEAAAREYRTRTTWIIQAIVNQLAKAANASNKQDKTPV